MKILSSIFQLRPLSEWDLSEWLLLVSNLSVIFFVAFFGWRFFEVIFAFVAQTAIIWFFTVLKILTVKVVDKGRGTPKHSSAERSPVVRIFGAIIFTIMGAWTHYSYLGFIAFFLGFVESLNSVIVEQFYIQLPILILFFISHLYSYFFNYLGKNEREMDLWDIGALVRMPVKRSVVMHLTVFGGVLLSMAFVMLYASLVNAGLPITFMSSFQSLAGVLFVIPFVLLKTKFDLQYHVIEHSSEKTIAAENEKCPVCGYSRITVPEKNLTFCVNPNCPTRQKIRI